MELKTQKLFLRFDPKIGNFTQLGNLVTGEDYIRETPRDPLVELYGLVDGKRRKLPGHLAEAAVDGNCLTLDYDSFGGYPVSMRVCCRCADDRVTISADIRNNSQIDVVEILMPHIGGIYLGGREDDYIIYPHHAGEKTKNPVLGYGVNKKDFWRASSVAYEDIYRREINYCGLASMSWMYYYNRQSGLYIGSHDPRFPVTGVIAETSGSLEHPWMAFGFRKHYRIRPGQTYETGE